MNWKSDDHWMHLIGEGPMESIKGKYLFFSPDYEKLKTIAEVECADHGFFAAKISLVPRGGNYVLCLYWFNDGRKRELASRHALRRFSGVHYRYWKSDDATRRGEYSAQHLRNLVEERHVEEEYEDAHADEDRPF